MTYAEKMTQAAPLMFYMTGSILFFIGSLLTLVAVWKGNK